MKQQKCTLHNNGTDWSNFQELLNTNFNKNILKTKENLIYAVEHFNTTIQTAAWESTPSRDCKDNKLNYSKTILDKIAKKRRIRKLWQLSRYPSTKTRLNRITKASP